MRGQTRAQFPQCLPRTNCHAPPPAGLTRYPGAKKADRNALLASVGLGASFRTTWSPNSLVTEEAVKVDQVGPAVPA
eukprot:10084141-Lingulodinium_polyedra.AAC.1